MKFSHPHFKLYKNEIKNIARSFHLNLENLFVEAFTPGDCAIFVETVDQKKFRIHINLQDGRIIAAKRLDVETASVKDFSKYVTFMK